MSPLWTLAPFGILYGIAMIWIFRRTANGPAIRSAVNRIQAHLLEFWLFVDEPRAIWKSWKGLLASNARLLRQLLVPLLILFIPTLPIFFLLDAFYGTSPLAVGEPAVVTLGIGGSLSRIPDLLAPDGMSVETPPVRVLSLHEVSWRIRPLRPLAGDLQWIVGGTKLAKSVAAGEGFRYLQRRTRSSVAPIQWVEISYPAGTRTHWSVSFIAFSLLGAIFARYFVSSRAIRSRN